MGAPGRFGRYQVLGKLATGGMAEVYLARQEGPAGFSKIAVVKRILPHLTVDRSFVEMFLNEARLAALVNHPNAVQIFELGGVDDLPAEEDLDADDAASPWLAMEFIDGKTLTKLLKAIHGLGQTLPVPLIARIAADACAGLDHAHELRDATGRPIELVHRDVSPENILLSFAGQVKVVDFGIAKATSGSNLTKAGTIKGKIAYMAPEQVRGQPVDRRADIFSVGIVMYQALSGHRPFHGNSEFETIEQIVREPPPPLAECGREAPPEMVAIVDRCLAKARDDRYATARELQGELEAFLARVGGGTPFQLSEFLGRTFPRDVDPDRVRIRRLLAGEPQPDPARSVGGTPISSVVSGHAPRVGTRPGVEVPRQLVTPVPPTALPEEARLSAAAGQNEATVIRSDRALARGRELPELPSLEEPAAREDEPTSASTVGGATSHGGAAGGEAGGESGPTLPGVYGQTPHDDRDEPTPPELRDAASGDGAPREAAPAPPARPVPIAAIAIGSGLGLVAAVVIGWVILDQLPAPPVDEGHVLAPPAGVPVPMPDRGPGRLDGPAPGGKPEPTGAGGATTVAEPAGAAGTGPGAASTVAAADPSEPTDPAGTPGAPDPGAPAPGVPAAGVDAAGEGKPDPAGGEKQPATAPPAVLTVAAPPGAEVLVAGKRRGTGPSVELKLAAGTHKLEVRGEGWQVSRTVKLASGQATTETFDAPAKGKLVFKVFPWAKVTLDGKELGPTPLPPVEVAPGKHTIVLTNPDLGVTKELVETVGSGEELVVKQRLVP